MALTDAIARTLAARGPCTGAALHAELGGELFALWKHARGSGRFDLRTVGRRYVRLDRTVPGFARLSPSILREFLTYTVVALPEQASAAERAARRLEVRARVISREKLRVATRFTDEVLGSLAGSLDPDRFCVLIAGDVVYDMSHDVTRHESSTGGLVDGSDLDLVVLASDDADAAQVEALDSAIHQRKWLYLRNPGVREEVDYVVKRFATLVEQSAFATFGHMVACKVFDEARLLRGNPALHEAGRRLLADAGVIDRLRTLEAEATASRSEREAYLLAIPGDVLPDEGLPQFYTDEESAEFEHDV